MTDLLETELTGAPIVVTIAGIEHRLEFRMAAVIAYKQRTGDSLFDPKAWARIDLNADPERWTACLWAAMHRPQPDKSWKAPLTFEELSGLIPFNREAVQAIHDKMTDAFARYFPRREPVTPEAAAAAEKKNAAEENASPTPPPASPASTSSGPSPVSASD